MNNATAKSAIKAITDTCTGIKIFFVDSNNNLFDSDVHNTVLDDFRDDFVANLRTKYVENENFTCPKLSLADDRSNALYHFDFDDDDKPLEFGFLDTVNALPANQNLDKYQVRSQGLSNLRGVVVRLKNQQGQVMSFFQHLHNLSLVTPGKGAFLTTHQTRVVKLEHDVLRLGHKFVMAKVGDAYLIENVNALEKELGFDKVIHSKAAQYCTVLENKALVNDLKKFNERLENETTFARKFVKIFKGSAVIEQSLTNEKIIEFAMSKPFYKEKLKLTESEDQFDLNSQQRCATFLRLLDDEFLKSELTGQDYIAKAKDRAS
ncbi:DUF4868 domain-containing protein [Vibrio parahaemolyticus]|uniref:anti-phage protein KwaB n=1 Tax=Vibrio vulnificus TaxID=672 RepID=UPI001A2B9526|nr:DUF4868 domain-containing protein [Vibrio parahaemolyticus]ELR8704592.1 DUF4868 domain-containing protein [Vibrio vulnificus]ELR8772827.1 DUF4868 domain-containing protein [Vibrio vulnificus]HAS8627314.1 DUF4868 domain-containing protein [Vibrio vulnificus]